MSDTRHPPQPREFDARGVLRFKRNQIVSDLLDLASKHGLDLNVIGRRGYSVEDQVQLAQLIGYSVSGFGDLSYVSDEEYERATAGEP